MLKIITKPDTGDKKSMWYYSLLKAITSEMIHKIARQTIELFKPDILINIPYDSSDTFDFHKAEGLIKIGENAANEAISNYLKS